MKRALSLKADFGPALEMQFRKKILDRDAAGAEEVARALSRLPDRKYWTLYGRVLFSERKLDQGMAEYARVLAEHKGDAGVSNEYSALLQGSGRRKEAAAQVSATLRADPNDADALLQRASLAIENGDLTAASLGVPVRGATFALHALAAFATAVAVTVAGSVGFVGLVIPHAVRLAIGNDQRWLMPAAALAGGALLTFADTIARTIVAPAQLPVGVLTAIVGVPLFLWLLRRSER